MDERALRDRLRRWSFPLGPFNSAEDVADDMAALARSLGPAAAPDLARMIVQFSDAEDTGSGELYEFAQVYIGEHEEAMGRAMLDALRPDGPPPLVELLGLARTGDVVGHLADTLDLHEPSEALAVGLASALAEVGEPDAARLLDVLEASPNLGPAAQHEISIARERLQQPS